MSVTIDAENVLWLKGRARLAGGNVSDTLDKLLTQARTGRAQLGRPPSVVGMVDLSDDPDLSKAQAAVQSMFDASIARFSVHEGRQQAKPGRRKRTRG